MSVIPGGKRLASFAIPTAAFALLSALAVLLFRGMAARDSLESRNDSERTMNVLLSSLRDHDDFGQAIESVASLKDKVVGVAAYDAEGNRIYAWGDAPEAPAFAPAREEPDGSPVSLYVDLPKTDSAALVFRVFRGGPPPREPPKAEPAGGTGSASLGATVAGADGAAAQGSSQADAKNERKEAETRADRRPVPAFFAVLRKADHVYLELRKPSYWRKRRLMIALFPIVEAALAGLIAFVFHLMQRNAEYRRRIDEQKNLVALGAAASTLAHEIKNPLSSIRLQTGILQKTWPAEARREIDIINDEVERLSAMSRRIGDYLRDPKGRPEPVDVAEMTAESARRLGAKSPDGPPAASGQDSAGPGAAGFKAALAAARAMVDPERLRSVIDNLVRNAMESYGPGADGPVEIDVESDGRRVTARIMDRGAGVDPAAASRVFDLFFTTKSRGTGIGLAISKRFVEAAGGSVWLERREGGGTVAAFELPVAGGPKP